MRTQLKYVSLLFAFITLSIGVKSQNNVYPDNRNSEAEELQIKADGYRGIWYQREKLDNEYKYKYSGGLATYCAKHQPFAVYSKKANKTFFCYGGTVKNYHIENNLDVENLDIQGLPFKTPALLHMVSYYDHETGLVPKPTILLDKQTFDAHDNPVISMDDEGFIWIFSTSHGPLRPSYIHKSKEPYSIDAFEKIDAYRQQGDSLKPFDNFSYMQAWNVPSVGFCNFVTIYENWRRHIFYIQSKDGKKWGELVKLSAFGQGHYQISAASPKKLCAAFNYHPLQAGLNWRTNLYYIESDDHGKTWQSADGTSLELPLSTTINSALVYDFEKDSLLVYMKDIQLDALGNPLILFITSKGFEAGPKNNPRTWMTAYWNDGKWTISPITTSDSNYDMGSIYVEKDGTWCLIAPTETGPQPYNPGGEIALWKSLNQGKTWNKYKQLTKESPFNHTYVRRPVNADPGFYSFWADGHGRQPSESSLYFCDQSGKVFKLPKKLSEAMEAPLEITLSGN